MPERYVPLEGGLDLSSSPLKVSPGALRDVLNFYESTEGGYERIGGNERFDGQLAPSEDTYWAARFDSWDTHVTDITAGSDLSLGGMDFHVLEVDDTSEADTLIAYICQLDSTTIPDDLDISPVNWDGVSSLVSITLRDADDDTEDERLLEAAWTYTRSQIGAVPGDDDRVKGCLQIDDTVVAFRSTGGVPSVYYSSSSGWTEGRIGRVAECSGLTGDTILPGETIASGDFEVAAVCEWYDSTGTPDVDKGWLVLFPLGVPDAPSTGAATASGGASFTIDSVIQPIGDYGDYIEYQNYNFRSDPEDNASWFVDGLNLAMCYSPRHKCVVPISTNFNDLANQKATFIRVHDDKLMFSTGEGTFVISEPNLPFNYSGIYGAVENGVGALINGLVDADSENLIVYSPKSAKKLTGSDGSWQFPNAASNIGSYACGMQKLDDVFSLSARGVSSLLRSEVTGGYVGGIISGFVRKLFPTLQGKFTCSTAIPSKEQVRWFFSDKTWLMMTRIQAEEGVRYSFSLGFDPYHIVRGASTETWSDGRERTFFVADDGYVREAEVGTNFDGESIASFLNLHSNHLRTPGRNKSFKEVFFEAESDEPVTLQLVFDINYGDKEFVTRDVQVAGGRSVLNESVYDEARYDASGRVRSIAPLRGYGFNIGFIIDHESKFAGPFTVTGYTINYENLGRAFK